MASMQIAVRLCSTAHAMALLQLWSGGLDLSPAIVGPL